MCPDSDSLMSMCIACRRPERRPWRGACPADCPRAIRSCENCNRRGENLPECELVREEGNTVCEFWPENNLPEKVRV